MPSIELPSVPIAELPPDATILDVREPFEWAAGHVDGAIHVPMGDLPATIAQAPGRIPRDRTVYVVCAVGARSAQVTAWLLRNGYSAVNIDGGMHAWVQAGRPVATSPRAV